MCFLCALIGCYAPDNIDCMQLCKCFAISYETTASFLTAAYKLSCTYNIFCLQLTLFCRSKMDVPLVVPLTSSLSVCVLANNAVTILLPQPASALTQIYSFSVNICPI